MCGKEGPSTVKKKDYIQTVSFIDYGLYVIAAKETEKRDLLTTVA